MKKTQKLLKAIATGAVGIALSLALNLDANAQNFTNTGTFTNHGTLRMVSADGTITGTGTGTGSSDANRIGGIVEWARKGNQAVQGLYYKNLLLSYRYPTAASGNTTAKTFAADQNYFVNGWYEKHSTTPGVGDDGNYTLTYATGSTFTYDGTNPQTILGGNGTYATLSLTGGEKRIYALDLANANPPGTTDGSSGLGTQLAAGNVVANVMNSATGANLLVSGSGGSASLNISGGTLAGAVSITGNTGGSATVITNNATGTPINFDGAVAITGVLGGTGTVDINGAGNVNIGTGGSLALDSENAILDMAEGSHLNVQGTITNNATNPTNLVLNNNNNGSTITYAGGQVALATVASNPYSNVVIGSYVDLGGNAYVAGDMTLNSGSLFSTLKKGSGAMPGSTDINDYYKIVFTEEDANLVTGSGTCGEVRGIVARSAWNTSTTYSFNNVATSLRFGVDPTTGQEAGFFVLPGTEPDYRDNTWPTASIGTGIGQIHIINRFIQPYVQNGPVTIAAGTLSMGYTTGERTAAGFEDGKGYRTFEGESTTNADLLSTGDEAQDANNCFYVAQATGVTSFGEAAYSNLASNVAVGSQLLITQNAPALITSVRNGRWSDPLTWNTGTQPISSDFVELSHKIWTGDGVGYLAGAGSRKFSRAEHQGAGVNNLGSAYQLSAKLTLNDGAGLFIGQAIAGNSGSYTGETGVVNDGIYTFGDVINNNTTAAGGSFVPNPGGTGGVTALSGGTTGTDATGLNGIYVVPANTGNIFRATTLDNKGSATNFGIAEVGSDE